MFHHMHLKEDPYLKIRNGEKRFELRLYDEKRKNISVNDIIEFECAEYRNTALVAKVIALHIFENFEELYRSLPLDKCGYSDEELTTASFRDMNRYYSEEAISKWGVVGIEIELVYVKTPTFIRTSRFISLVLRHKPSAAGIELDRYGWADVNALIEGVSKKHLIDFNMLCEIVEFNDKGRYSFNKDKDKIRANQGHSIPVDVQLEKVSPPDFLYHGTGEKYVESIDSTGLISKTRLYVHLSEDIETASVVGKRHGSLALYRISAAEMERDGIEFYKSVNGVWLVESVPAKYLSRIYLDKR